MKAEREKEARYRELNQQASIAMKKAQQESAAKQAAEGGVSSNKGDTKSLLLGPHVLIPFISLQVGRRMI